LLAVFNMAIRKAMQFDLLELWVSVWRTSRRKPLFCSANCCFAQQFESHKYMDESNGDNDSAQSFRRVAFRNTRRGGFVFW
jgi:hypothetical protein